MVKNTPGKRVRKPKVDSTQVLVDALGKDEITTIDALFARAGVKLTKAAVTKLGAHAAVFLPASSKPKDAFRSAHVCAKTGVARAAASDEVLLGLLRRLASAGDTRAHTVADLSKAAGPYDSAVRDALERRTRDRRWPVGVGAVRAKQSMVIFFLDDIAGGARAPEVEPSVVAEPPAHFATDFERAFERLGRDRKFGVVELWALRDALATYPRAVFDHELGKLRRAGRFELWTADGRHHAVTDQERAAAIEERGEQYFYVARRTRD